MNYRLYLSVNDKKLEEAIRQCNEAVVTGKSKNLAECSAFSKYIHVDYVIIEYPNKDELKKIVNDISVNIKNTDMKMIVVVQDLNQAKNDSYIKSLTHNGVFCYVSYDEIIEDARVSPLIKYLEKYPSVSTLYPKTEDPLTVDYFKDKKLREKLIGDISSNNEVPGTNESIKNYTEINKSDKHAENVETVKDNNIDNQEDINKKAINKKNKLSVKSFFSSEKADKPDDKKSQHITPATEIKIDTADSKSNKNENNINKSKRQSQKITVSIKTSDEKNTKINTSRVLSIPEIKTNTENHVEKKKHDAVKENDGNKNNVNISNKKEKSQDSSKKNINKDISQNKNINQDTPSKKKNLETAKSTANKTDSIKENNDTPIIQEHKAGKEIDDTPAIQEYQDSKKVISEKVINNTEKEEVKSDDDNKKEIESDSPVQAEVSTSENKKTVDGTEEQDNIKEPQPYVNNNIRYEPINDVVPDKSEEVVTNEKEEIVSPGKLEKIISKKNEFKSHDSPRKENKYQNDTKVIEKVEYKDVEVIGDSLITFVSDVSNGKSFLSWNLAHAFASRGQKVAYICLDRCNSAVEYFDLHGYESPFKNLTKKRIEDVLEEGININKNLTVFTGEFGKPVYLSNDVFTKILLQIKANYNIMIFDSATGYNDMLAAALNYTNVIINVFDLDSAHYKLNMNLLERFRTFNKLNKNIAIVNNVFDTSKDLNSIISSLEELNVFKDIVPIRNCGPTTYDYMCSNTCNYLYETNDFTRDFDALLRMLRLKERVTKKKSILSSFVNRR